MKTATIRITLPQSTNPDEISTVEATRRTLNILGEIFVLTWARSQPEGKETKNFNTSAETCLLKKKAWRESQYWAALWFVLLGLCVAAMSNYKELPSGAPVAIVLLGAIFTLMTIVQVRCNLQPNYPGNTALTVASQWAYSREKLICSELVIEIAIAIRNNRELTQKSIYHWDSVEAFTAVVQRCAIDQLRKLAAEVLQYECDGFDSKRKAARRTFSNLWRVVTKDLGLKIPSFGEFFK